MGNMRNMQGMPNMAGGHHRPSHMGPGGQPLLGPNMQQMPGQMQQMSGQMQQMPGQMQQMPGQMQQMPGQMQQMPGQMQQMQQMGGMPGQMGGQHAAAMAAAQQRNSPMSSVPQSPHMVPQSPLSQHGGMAPTTPHPGTSLILVSIFVFLPVTTLEMLSIYCGETHCSISWVGTYGIGTFYDNNKYRYVLRKM